MTRHILARSLSRLDFIHEDDVSIIAFANFRLPMVSPQFGRRWGRGWWQAVSAPNSNSFFVFFQAISKFDSEIKAPEPAEKIVASGRLAPDRSHSNL
jgi:hypothetical protein